MTKDEEAFRRGEILKSARWCFLHFGFGKTSLEDIAKRAGISRPLLYRSFKNKEEIFAGVMTDGFDERLARAEGAVGGDGSRSVRLSQALEILLLEPWAEMVSAPMAQEFFEACEAIAPQIEAAHRKRTVKLVQAVVGTKELAELFLMALDGLEGDLPSTATLRRRTALLVERFVG